MNKLYKIGTTLLVGVAISPIVLSSLSTTQVKADDTQQSYVSSDENQNINIDNTERQMATNINQNISDFNDQEYAKSLASKLNFDAGNLQDVNPNYIDMNSMDKGKAGLTTKAAGKLLKIGLEKLGKKGYEKLSEKTGLQLIGLNWRVIRKTANFLEDFDGDVEQGLDSALKKAGVSEKFAKPAAKTISWTFF